MAYSDFIERGNTTSFKGLFQLDSIYKEICKWAKKNRYELDEKQYRCDRDHGEETLVIILELKKKVNDYAKLGLDITINATGIKNIKAKNKVMQEGDVSISIDSYILRDYDDVWSRKFLNRFLRECFDKFIAPGRFDADCNECKKDLKDLKNMLKDFFNAPKLKK